ncbi:MAG: IclR family transcriptional regulator [Hyphomicrobiales bacterium]|nr:IclR family transcriptional regulator [Hyphomicrobiales bacterium]
MSEKSRTTRALTILERVAGAERPLRIADLVEACDLPKATVHRICTLLRSQGYLRTDIGGKGLVPGPRLRTLSEAVMANQSQFVFRHAVLESVARQIGETCNISVPDGLSMIYWDRVETEWPLKVQLPVGTRVPLYCTASGKLFLASLPPARRRQMIARLDLEARTPNTITDKAALETALAEVARNKLGTDDEEFIEGMAAISVPIADATGRVYATLSFHAPVVRMSLDEAMEHTDMLRMAAEDLSGDVQRSEDAVAAAASPGLHAG